MASAKKSAPAPKKAAPKAPVKAAPKAAPKAPAKPAPKPAPAKSAPKPAVKMPSAPAPKPLLKAPILPLKKGTAPSTPAGAPADPNAPPTAPIKLEKHAGRDTLAQIEIVKDGHFFIARTQTDGGADKEYKNTVFEDLLTEMIITLQEQLADR